MALSDNTPSTRDGADLSADMTAGLDAALDADLGAALGAAIGAALGTALISAQPTIKSGAKTKAIEALNRAVHAAIEEHARQATRLRILHPWIEDARRLGAAWRDLILPLAPVVPIASGGNETIQVNRIRNCWSAAQARQDVIHDDDIAEMRARIATVAGVALPAPRQTRTAMRRRRITRGRNSKDT